MRFSYSLSRNIFEAGVGSLVNKLHLSRRRYTLFFGDLIAEYFKECEKSGFGNEMAELGQKWVFLCLKNLVPNTLKKLPSLFFLNNIMKNTWKNMGLVDDFLAEKEANNVKIKTKNEGLTELIGKNNFMVGFYMGELNFVFDSRIVCLDSLQKKHFCQYDYKITKDKFFIESKEKILYKKLNSIPKIKGFTLKDAISKKIFNLKKNNQLYFRNKIIYPVESTILHLVSNKGIKMEKVPSISYNYFKELVKESSEKEKLLLLKNLLQTMGWGIVNIFYSRGEIKIVIKNPPYGFQTEKDNWNFLVKMILGYLWLIRKEIKIKNVMESYKNLVIDFA